MIPIGVLALQGSVIEHINMLKRIEGIVPVSVKKTKDLENINGLIIPGGESTAIGLLLDRCGLADAIVEKTNKGMPIWGTCAGMILMAKKIVNYEKTFLGIMDISVVRNAYGSQLDSFETDYCIPQVSDKKTHLTFIRAPYIESAGKGVQVLCTLSGHIVAARQNNMLVTSFHPELTDDTTFHKYFINMAAGSFLA